MKKTIGTLLLATICTYFGYAGNTTTGGNSKSENSTKNVEQISSVVNLSGTILDMRSNETLAGATIIIDGKKYYSDLDGNFNLSSLTLGKHSISIELISYKNKHISVNVENDTKINILLEQ